MVASIKKVLTEKDEERDMCTTYTVEEEPVVNVR